MEKIEIGKKYGMLTVLEDLHKTNKYHYKMYKCQCDCSNICEKSSGDLKREKNPNCGCIIGRNFKHHMRYSSEYGIWRNMMTRCLNEKSNRYKNYGGRGIKICQRWLDDFMNFYNDMGPRPSVEHTLDRIDVDGDYCPENCRWATYAEQSQNTTYNKFTADDIRNIRKEYQEFIDNIKETKKLRKDKIKEIADRFESKPSTIYGIIYRKTWKNIQ